MTKSSLNRSCFGSSVVFFPVFLCEMIDSFQTDQTLNDFMFISEYWC